MRKNYRFNNSKIGLVPIKQTPTAPKIRWKDCAEFLAHAHVHIKKRLTGFLVRHPLFGGTASFTEVPPKIEVRLWKSIPAATDGNETVPVSLLENERNILKSVALSLASVRRNIELVGKPDPDEKSMLFELRVADYGVFSSKQMTLGLEFYSRF